MIQKPVFKEGEIIRHVEEDEFDAILALLDSAFPHVPGEFFANITLRDPAYDPRFSLAVERDGAFLSYLQIFDRNIWVGGKDIRIGGIGSVATSPQNRRKGYSTALLLESIDLMKSVGMKASVLFTSIQPYYAKLGWETVTQRFQEIPVQQARSTSNAGISLSGNSVDVVAWPDNEASTEDFFRSVKGIHSGNKPHQTGKIDRDQAYWARQPQWCDDRAYRVDIDGTSRFYFRYRMIEEGALLITEHGLASEREAERLIKMILDTAAELGAERVIGNFFASKPLRRYLETSTLPLQDRINDYMMWHDLQSKTPLHPSIQKAADRYDLTFWVTDAF